MELDALREVARAALKEIKDRFGSSPDIPHKDTGGKSCNGIFIFERESGIPDERVCKKCRRKETYIRSRFILAAKDTSVTETDMLLICKDIYCILLPQREAQLVVGQSEIDFRHEVGLGRSAQGIVVAATVFVPQGDMEKDPFGFLAGKIKKDHFQNCIGSVFRKPIALDDSGNQTPYS